MIQKGLKLTYLCTLIPNVVMHIDQKTHIHNVITTGCALTCSEPINQLTLFRTGAPAGIAGGNQLPSLPPAGAQSTHTHATVVHKSKTV